MPLPAPTPTVPNNTQWGVSGGTGYQSGVSGINFVSGATSALGNNDTSGPWSIETQWLTVTYHRVPKGLSRNSLTEADFSLSGFSPAVNTVSGYLYGTELACHVEARATKSKSYDPYTTSAYHQPQKFQVNPLSADANGTSYGSLATGTFGPAGTVTTSQKFFNRRLWDDTVDAVYDDTCNAYSYYGVVSGAQGHSYPASGFGLYIQPVPSQSFAQKLSLFLGWDWGGFDELSPINVPYLCRLVVGNTGYAGDSGAYAAASDTVADVINTLDTIGTKVVTGQWLYHSDRFNINTNWNGCLAWYPVDTSLLCTHYSINRHDYS